MKVKDPANTLTDPKAIKKAFETKSKDLRYYFPTSRSAQESKKTGANLVIYGMIMFAAMIVIAIIIIIAVNSYYYSHINLDAILPSRNVLI